MDDSARQRSAASLIDEAECADVGFSRRAPATSYAGRAANEKGESARSWLRRQLWRSEVLGRRSQLGSQASSTVFGSLLSDTAFPSCSDREPLRCIIGCGTRVRDSAVPALIWRCLGCQMKGKSPDSGLTGSKRNAAFGFVLGYGLWRSLGCLRRCRITKGEAVPLKRHQNIGSQNSR